MYTKTASEFVRGRSMSIVAYCGFGVGPFFARPFLVPAL